MVALIGNYMVVLLQQIIFIFVTAKYRDRFKRSSVLPEGRAVYSQRALARRARSPVHSGHCWCWAKATTTTFCGSCFFQNISPGNAPKKKTFCLWPMTENINSFVDGIWGCFWIHFMNIVTDSKVLDSPDLGAGSMGFNPSQWLLQSMQ